MNDIIKNIEAAQMKAEVPQFNRRYGKSTRLRSKRVTVREFSYLKELY